ncbi:hypothetical protein CNE_BB1p07290 (plasmid) [Cupriavidus necator N-1]|uniref:Ubiquinone biosynthesis accessory factor UbiT n=1 Tax=Cupriavidus necator (strain ATCC 43291 / DSM 13513 / CCUG 52238 / LMG 8453 / N-1) TaxID=1042878 RepID=F8GXS6_CUPNN|nr:SCP2 sterol-binding domain-containing protein [Cupriavidus necator]AEI82146.1 hypothetical protein CNE_BB1p07290 [Cupriavidus necator N-1]MDX6007175.1 SCP2 sterol-binding domain-containing protein [Cupriavidus necator]
MSVLFPLLARAHRRLPAPQHALPLVGALEAARRADWLTPPAALDGHGFLLCVEDLALTVHFRCADGGFYIGPFNGTAPALTLCARAGDYLRLLAGEADTDTLFFQRRLAITGDTALGLEVKYWLDAAPRPPWVVAASTRLSAMMAA